ncbi:hypothetical protein B0H12DRAFT_216366 [Mycena haematopus]|nr:hypothetical protein B0H12DRAFT_216366 [Mycena haematopus]
MSSPHFEIQSFGYSLFDQVSYGVGLCPGHILLTHNSPRPHVRLYSFASFDNLWAPITQLDFNAPANAITIPPALVLELASNNAPGDSQANTTVFPMTALFESPIHADTYELISEVTGLVPRRGVFTRLLSLFRSPPLSVPPLATNRNKRITTRARYRLTLGSIPGRSGPSEPPRFSVQSVVRHSSVDRPFASRAGYGLWYDGPSLFGDPSVMDTKFVVQRLDSIGGTKPLKLAIPDGSPSPSEAPYEMCLTYSGAVLAMYYSKIVVSHYL